MHLSTELSKLFNLKKIFKASATLLIGLILTTGAQPVVAASGTSASSALEKIQVKGSAPMTGYARSNFSDGWGRISGCDTRNYILKRDLTQITWRESPACTVDTGLLKDRYTGKTIHFVRGVSTSLAVQIDHVVSLGDAWRTGGQKLSANLRYNLFNDPLNLLAVDGPSNSRKQDSNAASWLPPNKSYRCAYVARQIAVKIKYKLWVVAAEKSAMQRILATCPKQKLPNS